MKIAYIDGQRLKRALLAGSERLGARAAHLNAINVFPVPDGDTGTNMAGTARTMALGLQGGPSGSLGVGAASRLAADSALRGARGNSGAIFAQFLHGLAEELEDEVRIGTRRFAAAVRGAAARAQLAIFRPREGTMLTVLRDWSEALHRLSAQTDDFLTLMHLSLEEARASLARTPSLLPELKRAGVVDAGAAGFVSLLEGILAFIRSGRIRELASRSARGPKAGPGAAAAAAPGPEARLAEAELPRPDEGLGPGSGRYCVECLVSGEGMDLDSLREGLAALGDSVIVAGSPGLAKVHVHTDEPPRAFRLVALHGAAAAQKVDDMELQRRLALRGRRPCALLTDSACDLPDELGLELGADRAPVLVELDGSSYLDRDGLAASDFYELLGSNPTLSVSTSQPPHELFARKLDLLLGSADEVVYVGISAALSGTIEGGRRAAAEGGRAGRVRVVDSRSISVGAALVARRAAEAARDGASGPEVEALAAALARRSRLLVAAPDLSGLIRSGRLSGLKALAALRLGLRPLITFDELGRAASAGLYLGPRRGRRALLAALKKTLPEGSPIEAMIGHAGAPEEAALLAGEIGRRYRLERDILVTQVSPALAAHAGRGALALSFLGPER